jgi:site-specific DNA-methyltransferase (adenine-specific)
MTKPTVHLGDALRWLETLDDDMADIILADPPYSSGGTHSGTRAGTTGKKYLSSGGTVLPDFTGDSRDQRSWTRWMGDWLGEAYRVTKPGGLACVFTDWRQLPCTTDALQAGGWVWRGIVVWDKTKCSRPQKGRYRNQAEYIVWGTKGDRPMTGPAGAGVITEIAPRHRTHQTEKPLLVLDGLLELVPQGGTVIDPFAGSGAAGKAACKRGLRYLGCELVPEIHAGAVSRLNGSAL